MSGAFCTTFSHERIPAAAVAGAESPGSQYFFSLFCDFQQRLEKDGFAEKLVFSDEATFHVCGKVNRHNVHIWDMENPHATMEHVCD